MKKAFSIVLVFTLLLSLFGCKKENTVKTYYDTSFLNSQQASLLAYGEKVMISTFCAPYSLCTDQGYGVVADAEGIIQQVEIDGTDYALSNTSYDDFKNDMLKSFTENFFDEYFGRITADYNGTMAAIIGDRGLLPIDTVVAYEVLESNGSFCRFVKYTYFEEMKENETRQEFENRVLKDGQHTSLMTNNIELVNENETWKISQYSFDFK